MASSAFESTRSGSTASLGFVLLFFVAALLAAYLPDRLARTRAEPIVWRSLPLMRLLHWITLPLTKPLLLISLFLVSNLMGMRSQEDGTQRRRGPRR
jgi:CBS domain containing-hemolysin-like protein